MISICIPVYNFNINELLIVLHAQIKESRYDHEIIVIDDASLKSRKEKYVAYAKKYGRFVELEYNVGRSRIRNLFLQYAKHDHLLFLDCDSKIVNNDFLRKYEEVIEGNIAEITCGGRQYPTKCPSDKQRLRWKYGIKAESKSYSERMQKPNKSFMSNNFLIKKELLDKVRFEERLSQYGHEDTLFGYNLQKQGVVIHHIDNTVLNGEIEENGVFVTKTERGIENLVKILKYVENPAELAEQVSILKTYNSIKAKGLLSAIRGIGKVKLPLLKVMLLSGVTNLKLFNMYKLYYFTLKCAE